MSVIYKKIKNKSVIPVFDTETLSLWEMSELTAGIALLPQRALDVWHYEVIYSNNCHSGDLQCSARFMCLLIGGIIISW